MCVGVALVLSIRHPWSWMLALLTKPTLGVGLGWYVGRRDWRSLAIALAATAAVAAVPLVMAPDLWLGWFERIRGAGTRGGAAWTMFLVVRLILAGLLSLYAGWRRRPEYLPIALYLALPIPWLEGLTMLAAVPRLMRRGDQP